MRNGRMHITWRMSEWLEAAAKAAIFVLATVFLGVVVNLFSARVQASRKVAIVAVVVAAMCVGIVAVAAVYDSELSDERFISDNGADIRELLTSREPKDLLDVAQQIATAEPDDARVQQYVASAYRRVGRCQDAVGIARRAVELDRSAGTLSELGRSQACTGEVDAGIASLTKAIESWPNDPTPRLALAQVLGGAGGDNDAAILQAEEARRLATQTNAVPLEPPYTVVELLNSLGGYYDSAEEWTKSEEAYRAAIRLNPGDGTAYVRLGFYPLDETGRYADAVEAITRGIELHETAYGHYALGWLLANRSDVEDLREALERNLAALALDPTYESARFAAAGLYERQGNLTSAVALLEDAPTPSARIIDQLVDYYARLDDTESFVRSVEERLTAGNTSEIPIPVLGECLSRARAGGRPDLAAACGEQLILAQSDDPWPLYLTAVASREAGTPRPELLDRARQLADERSQQSGATPSDFEFLGYILSEQGHRAEAYAAFERSIAAGGDPAWLQQFLDFNQ